MKVFVSHSSKDHDFVLLLAEKMRKDSIDVWIDDWELKVGDSIVQKINDALEKSSFLIIILSENSLESDWVKKEISSTLMRQLTKDDVKILPVLLGVGLEKLPPLLSDVHSVQFSRGFINESQYHKLIEPIKEGKKTNVLLQYQDSFFDNIEHIDIILKRKIPTKKEIEFVLKLIEDLAYQNYFFKRCSSLSWFSILKNNNYFEPSEATRPHPVNREGIYSIPQWNVLTYLENVSEQVKQFGNEGYIDDLLDIIRNVSSYKDSEGNHIDNYRTWWFFVKILVNIPPERIPIDIINFVPTWLDSKFDTSLPGADIINKLLSNFLSDPYHKENLKKAEKIIKYVTKLKRVKTGRENAFADENDKYSCVIDHYWLDEGFKKHGKDIGGKCSETVVIDFSKKIKKMLQKKEARTSISMVNRPFLLTLKEAGSTLYDLKVFDNTGKECNQTYEEAFEDIVQGKKVKRKLIDQYRVSALSLHDFVAQASDILRQHKLFGRYDKEELLADLYDLYYGLYSKETYWSFYEKRRYGRDNSLGVLTLALQEILLAKANSDYKATKQILQEFFKDKYIFFPKLALYIVGNTGKDYVNCFWQALNSESQDIIFDSLATRDELGHVLKNIARDLTEDKAELLERIIECGPKYLRRDNREHWIDLWKQERFEALRENPHFGKRHDSYKQKTGTDVSLRPAISDGGTWVGPGPSALTIEQILEIPNVDLADYLNTFKETGQWEKPTERGLAEALRQTVQGQPAKFLDNANAFLGTGYLYVDYILWGISDALRNKKVISWGNLFDFIKSYISQDAFWENKLPMGTARTWTPDHESVCGMISEIIQGGLQDDKHAIRGQYLTAAKEIVFLILDRLSQPKADKGELRDPVTHALNTAFGKIIAAFMQLALRIYWVNKKTYDEKEVKWDNGFREKFDDLLTREIVEAYTWLGYYLPQLLFLDKQFAQEKVSEMDERRTGMTWEAFMTGYLFGDKVYNDVYPIMKSHYDYALTFPFKENHYRERIVQHVTIGYMQGLETIDDDDSLFNKILMSGNFEQIREVINFFWMQREYLIGKSGEIEKVRRKITDFWGVLNQQYAIRDAATFDKNEKLLLSDLSKLTGILENLNDESFNWLMLLAPFVHEDFNAPFFIEALDRLKDRGNKQKVASYIGQIYVKMLQTITPDYDQNHIRSIVEFLYNTEAKNAAKDICNIYGSRGHEFLRDIYEKYNREDGR